MIVGRHAEFLASFGKTPRSRGLGPSLFLTPWHRLDLSTYPTGRVVWLVLRNIGAIRKRLPEEHSTHMMIL